MCRCNPGDKQLTHLKTAADFMETIWEKYYWKNCTKDLHQIKENPTKQNYNNHTQFEIGQPVMIKNYIHHTFKPKYYWTTRY